MLKNRVGFAASSCHFVDTIVLFTIYQIYICIEMVFFWSDRILAKVDAERKTYIKNTSREIGSRFETYFSWSSKTGPCIFLDQAKYRAKYSYLWHRETGLRGDQFCRCVNMGTPARRVVDVRYYGRTWSAPHCTFPVDS